MKLKTRTDVINLLFEDVKLTDVSSFISVTGQVAVEETLPGNDRPFTGWVGPPKWVATGSMEIQIHPIDNPLVMDRMLTLYGQADFTGIKSLLD